MKLRRATGALLGVALLSLLTPASSHGAIACTDGSAGVRPVPVPGEVAGATGQVALPEEKPTQLVVMMHGYGHTSDSWVTHMARTAERGAIAFAMDYRGQFVDDEGNIRGWRVTEGAEESLAVAHRYLAACPSIEEVFAFGISMGGNTAGLLVAAGETKPDGSPLVDTWIAGEPAANMIETYLEATLVAPAVPTGARAVEDIEEETGGTLWEVPEEYASRTVVLRADAIAASGVEGVVVLHGLDDGLVPYNQGRELATVLRAHGVPTDFYTFLRRNPDGDPDHEGGSTLSENVGDPLWENTGQGQYPEPLTGHGTESSQTHILVQRSLEVLFELMEGDPERIPADREFLVDGEAGEARLL